MFNSEKSCGIPNFASSASIDSNMCVNVEAEITSHMLANAGP